MSDKTLLDKLLDKVRNNKVGAAALFLSISIIGISSLTNAVKNIEDFFKADKKDTPVIAVKDDPPPAKKVWFKEVFSLGEQDTFVSDYGVTVSTGSIGDLQGHGLSAWVGASSSGAVSYGDVVYKGKQIELSRQDCDSLMVVIKDIQFTWPKDITPAQLNSLGPAGEGLVSRKVTGFVSGKCEERM